MDLVIGLLWLLAFSVIILFLGTLHYFIGRSHSDIKLTAKKSQSDTTNQQQQQQSNRTSTSNNRKKHARKQRQQAAAAAAAAANNENSNSNDTNEDKQEIKSNLPEVKIKEEEESSVQLTDEEQEQQEDFQDPIEIEELLIPSPPTPIQKEQKPILPVKHRNKNRINHRNSKSPSPSISSKEESTLPSKPQASVAPVKQSLSSIPTTTTDSKQISQDNNSKSNGKLSSCNIYSYSEHNSIPPRFQQQRQQKDTTIGQKSRQRKTKQSSIPPDSAARQNDFVPSTSQQQINDNNQLELSLHNGYSSESDILTESSSTTRPISTKSQLALKASELKRSLSPANIFLDELVSIFDTTSFSSDELELILNKITTKHLLNKQNRQRLSSTNIKNDKTIERILDETYRNQIKILAIELQTEKNRVLELTKVNTDMDNAIRQFQQPNNNMVQYQQTVLHYQMQIRRVTDENARLAQQLHAYSIMPASINELKQQQAILNEQLRQLTIRNSNLEKEIADGDRATKHAAEIYRKADTQKQERIEQMVADINKYKKIDRDLSALQTKHTELEKDLTFKLDNITHQRDELQKSSEQLKEKLQQYEQLQIKYDEFIQNQTKSSNIDELQQELNELKAKNDVLRQRNWKIMEQLNKLGEENQSS